jgi:hypothetical protein
MVQLLKRPLAIDETPHIAKYMTIPLVSKNKTVGLFVVASLVFRLTMMGSGFIALRWISPANLGAWQFALLIEQLLYFLRLGVPNAINRQVPILLGQGRREDSKKVFQQGMTYMLICAGLLIGVILLYLLFGPRLEITQRNALLGLMAIAPLNILVNLFEGIMRGAQTLRKIGFSYIYLTPVAIISIVLPAYYGFEGYMARLVVIATLQVVIMAFVFPMPLKVSWDIPGYIRLIKSGFPLYVWNYLSTISASILPWYIGIMGGVVMLGQLGPANSLLAFIALVPASISSYFGPSQNFALGEGRDPRILIKRLKRAFIFTLGVTVVVSLFGASLFGYVVRQWLPAYVPITDAVYIIAAIGCARCYVIVQTTIGLFLDWWLIRTSLVVLLLTRAVCIFAIYIYRADSFREILSIWLVGELLYLMFQWWQLAAYTRRLAINTSMEANQITQYP